VATEGELSYFDNIGEGGRAHALAKPFSDDDRGGLFLEVGAVLSLLPNPPASVLDCGCGTGWLTWLLSRCGYASTGIDVAPRAIQLAGSYEPYAGVPHPRFVVGEVEEMTFDREFDAVVFFDSLHHTVDEEAALRNVLRALRPGGVCITSEPGRGHAEASVEELETYGVTERDMPARHIVDDGRRVGFANTRMYPRADSVGARLYGQPAPSEPRWKQMLRRNSVVRSALTIRTTEYAKRDSGIVVMTAPLATGIKSK